MVKRKGITELQVTQQGNMPSAAPQRAVTPVISATGTATLDYVLELPAQTTNVVTVMVVFVEEQTSRHTGAVPFSKPCRHDTETLTRRARAPHCTMQLQ